MAGQTTVDRKIADRAPRDKAKLIIIALEPTDKDKDKIFDSTSSFGGKFLRTCNKSKLPNKNTYFTYIKDEHYPQRSFARKYLAGVIGKCVQGYMTKGTITDLSIAFTGEETFNEFVADYDRAEINFNDPFTIFLNKVNKTIDIDIIIRQLGIDIHANIPYTIIHEPKDLLLSTNEVELISQLDSIASNFSSGKELVEMKNAEYVSIPRFIEYLDTVKQAYLDKKIKYVAFDIETNTVEWSDPWAKICLVSMADKMTNMAYSCAQFHPEVWVSKLRNDFFAELRAQLNNLCVNNLDFDTFKLEVTNLLEKIKSFRASVLVEAHEVLSIYEDQFLDALQPVLDALKKIKKPTKKTSDTVETLLADSKKQLLVFAKENADLLQKIKANVEQTPQHLKNMQALWNKLDEVLSIVPIVGQNIKFDVGFLYSKNIAKDKIKIVGDTLAEAVLLTDTLDSDGMKKDLDLESLYERETGKQNAWKSFFKSSDRIKVKLQGTRYDNVELEKLGPYSAMDSYGTLELHELMQEKLKARVKEDGCNKAQTFLMEQYKAISMFCSGEIMKWSPLTKFTKILYETSITDTKARLADILNLNIVKKFLETHSEFKINSAGREAHKAMILFNKEYFNFASIDTGKSGAPSTDTDKVLKPLLAAIKSTLTNNLPYLEYKKLTLGPNDTTKEVRIEVTEEYRETLKEAKIFIESLLNYSMWNKLNTAYISSRWDEANQQAIPYHADFKMVNATYSGRLSSGFHTLPQAGHIRDLYASIWNSESNRVLEMEHVKGETYNPDPGLVEIEYEDGTKEIKTWKEVQKEVASNV